MNEQTFIYPRRLAWILAALSGVFELGWMLSADAWSETAKWTMALLSLVPFLIGLLTLRFRIVVGETSIDVVNFKHTRYALADVKSIVASRTGKGGIVGVVSFTDGRKLNLSDLIDGFKQLLHLLSERTSLPIVTPVWQPDLLDVK